MGVAITSFTAVIAMPLSNCLKIKLVFWLLLLVLMPQVHARDVSMASGNLLLTPSHGQGEAWGKSKCSSCHFMSRLHNTVPKIKVIVEKKGFSTCTGCHGSNGTKAARQCLVCHNVNDLPVNPIRTGKHRHDFNLKKDLPTTSAQCEVCHVGSDMDGTFEIKQDLTMFNDKFVGKSAYVDVNDFCIRCHNRDHQQKKHKIKNAGKRDQSIAAENDFLKIDKHGVTDGAEVERALYPGLREGYQYKSIVDCVDCHTMHGTKNPGLIIDDSRKGVFHLDAQFRKEAYKAEIFDGVNTNGESVPKSDYSQLCVLCHSMNVTDQERKLSGGAQDTGNGLNGVHFNDGADCVTCHSHGERVQKGL